MNKLIVIALALPLITAACSIEPAAPEAPAADGTVEVPNSEGLRAVVPDNAKPNGFGGAAGFHNDEKTISVVIRKVSDPSQTFEAAKASSEEILFTAWISSDKTADGWILAYESVTMDMEGNTMPAYAYQVVKDVGGDKYKCYGSVASADLVAANVDICKSLKKG